MTTTSANLNDLASFVNGTNSRLTFLDGLRMEVQNKANVVYGGCAFQTYSTHSLASLANLLTTWGENGAYINTIRDNLIAADNYDAAGNAVVSDATIHDALVAAGLDTPPDAVTISAVEMYGQPPYSGFIDDPIGLANGNFLQAELDLEVFGRARFLSVVRTYNSRDVRLGRFGPGWSSVLDVKLDVSDDVVAFRGPDGGGSEFGRDGERWLGGRRRRLALQPSSSGWIITEGRERTWEFDRDGLLLATATDDSRIVVQRIDDAVVLHEQISGRWVGYAFDSGSGQVRSATTSDGRVAEYRYDESNRLVGVHSDRGARTYGVDDANRVIAITDADGVRLCFNTYDRFGRVMSQVSPRGVETRYEYQTDGVSRVTSAGPTEHGTMVHDRRGRLTAMIDSLGNTMRLAYDDEDNVLQVVDRTNRATRYRYDDRGNVLTIRDPAGERSFSWDTFDRLVTEVDRAGNITSYTYDTEVSRRPSEITYADRSAVRFTYADAGGGRPTSICDADGVTLSFEWNADGELVRCVDPVGSSVVFNYDDIGLPVAVEGPSGRCASAAVDRAGRLLRLSTPDGDRTYAFSPAGRAQSGTEPNGLPWSVQRDTAGEVVAVCDAEGVVRELERDDLGRVVTYRDLLNGSRRFTLDALGRTVAVTDVLDQAIQYTFDEEGRVTGFVDEAGRESRVDLDASGRPTELHLPGGGSLVLSYYPNGEIASLTDQLDQTWTYGIDGRGRVTSVTDPLGHATTYRYTPGGRLAEVRSPLGRTVTCDYDASGSLTSITEADGTIVDVDFGVDGSMQFESTKRFVSADVDDAGRFSSIRTPAGRVDVERERGEVVNARRNGARSAQFIRNENGDIEKVVDPAGVTTTFERDLAGRVISQVTGDVSASYEWDSLGRLVAAVDGHGRRTAYSYDERGVVDQIVQPDGGSLQFRSGDDGLLQAVVDDQGVPQMSFERNAAGSVVAATAGSSRLTANYDPVGRLTELANDVGAVRYEWDADGLLVGLGDQSGHALEIDRGANGKALRFRTADGLQIEAPADPNVDRDENRRIVRDEAGRTYSYDEAGRLVEVTVGAQTTTYEYNEIGLLAAEQGPTGRRTYSYGSAGELLSSTQESAAVHYEYDAEGRRILERSSDGSTTSYEWSSLGRLTTITRTAPDGSTRLHRLEHDPIGRPMSVDGVPVIWSSVGIDSLVGIGDERYCWSGNQVCVLSGSEQTWDRRTTDDPWGANGEAGLRLGYRGSLALDDLVFLGARVYDAASRSFLSRDPLLPSIDSVTFAGSYAYAWCDPVNYVDPTGLQPLSDEEYKEFRDNANKALWRAAGTVAIIALSVAATVLIPVGGSIFAAMAVGTVVGAAAGAATEAINGGSWSDIGRAALIGGVLGGLTAGVAARWPLPKSTASSAVSRYFQNTARSLPLEMGNAGVSEAATSFIPIGGAEGDGRFDFGSFLLEGTAGAVFTGMDSGGVVRTNNSSAADMTNIDGIGPTVANRIVERNAALGGFTSADQIKAIPGVGPLKLNRLMGSAPPYSHLGIGAGPVERWYEQASNTHEDRVPLEITPAPVLSGSSTMIR